MSAIGGVFRAPAIREPFEDLLRAVHPGVRFEAPHGTGLDGTAGARGARRRPPAARPRVGGVTSRWLRSAPRSGTRLETPRP